MKQTLEFRQQGKLSTIFVHHNYPLYNSDVQLLVDAGIIDPREIKARLHTLGFTRLKRSNGDEK